VLQLQMMMNMNGSCALVAKDGISMLATKKRSRLLSTRDYRRQRSAIVLYCSFLLVFYFSSIVLSALFLLELYLPALS